MHKSSFREKTRYWFDNLMSKGTPTLIGALAIVSVLLIVVISLIVFISKSIPDKSFIQIIWMSLMRTLDAGTMGGDEGSWLFLLFMFAVTLGGIFVISVLIGFVIILAAIADVFQDCIVIQPCFLQYHTEHFTEVIS